jgi:flagellar basal-body rod protein FlgG
MIKSLNTAATGMRAQQTNMDVISNNIANVNTTGFKRARAEFEDLLYQTQKEPGAKTGENSMSPTGVQTGLGVKTAAIQKDMEMGSPKITRNALDMSIEGEGFFIVQTPDGQPAYTRDGAFKKDATGKIVDKNGYAIQPEITVPPNASAVSITGRGEVSVNIAGNPQPQVIGNIEIASFINPTGLKSTGRNLYVSTPASGQAQNGTPGANNTGEVAQGQLEASNVNIVEAMVDMITAQRAYETNSKVIQASDQMLQTTNQLR